MATSAPSPVLRLIRRIGIVRPIDVEAHGIPRAHLYRLVREGLVERQSRGLYVASRHPYTTEHTLAQVAKRVANGVLIGLEPALTPRRRSSRERPCAWSVVSAARSPYS